jgi:Flp pilus assembly protein TadG
MAQRFRSDERGQAMTEVALVLPLLALLLFAVIQFGIAFNNYLTLTDAVRVGARQAAVSRKAADPLDVTTKKIQAAAEGLALTKLKIKVTAVNGAPATWAAGSDVKVRATYPYDIDLLGFVVASGLMSSTTVERVE